jgi:hypothetical protein
MPIPALPQEGVQAEVRGHLRLVGDTGLAAARPSPPYSRLIAHVVDGCVLTGFSLYSAKVSSILLISFYGGAINATEKAAAGVFRHAFDYSAAQLFAASLSIFSVLYFVGLPLVFARTPGQAMLGLRMLGEVSPRALAMRLFGLALNYASGGLLCLVGLRQRDGRFLQDILSRSIVVKDADR